MADPGKRVDEAVKHYAAEEQGAVVIEWFLIAFVETIEGEKTYLRLSPTGQDPHHTGGLIQHAEILHQERVRGMGK
jgi:hypothetical protein